MSDSSLLLTLQHAEQLDPIVRSELEQFAVSLQNWASKVKTGSGDINIQGMGTFLGQPRVKIFKRTAESIPNAVDTIVTWDRALTGSPLEEYDDDALFDGSQYVVLTEPGLYFALAEMEWAANATGYRVIGIHPKIPAVDYFTKVSQAASATSGVNHMVVSSMFPVIKDSPLGSAAVPFPLPVGVQVFQNSGGALNLSVGNDKLGIWKVS